MVIGKTLIKDHTFPDRDLGEVFTAVNNLLCEANSEGLFITAFEGVLDLAISYRLRESMYRRNRLLLQARRMQGKAICRFHGS